MLPDKVTEILKSNRQGCLGTVAGDEPYLSLMIYTFMADEEVLVMSSRADSTKIRNIQKNPRAAILIHEDEQLANPVSMSLNGLIRIETGERAEKYKALHLHNHPAHSQFILGEQMAVLIFVPQRSVLADRQDKVSYWERENI